MEQIENEIKHLSDQFYVIERLLGKDCEEWTATEKASFVRYMIKTCGSESILYKGYMQFFMRLSHLS